MRAIRLLFGLTLVGALAAPLVMFIYQSFTLVSSGVSRDEVPVSQLLLDVMHLDSYAILGAGGGAALAIIVLVFGLLGRLLFNRSKGKASGPASDPDQIIRNQRAQVAEEYLERRRSESRTGEEETGPGSPSAG